MGAGAVCKTPGPRHLRSCFAVAIALGLVFAGPAVAQERITAERFLDLALGKTFHFHHLGSGRHVGIEEFLRRDLSVYKPRGRDCIYGQITIERGQLCFLYEGEQPHEKSCWYTFIDDGVLMVRGTEVFGAEVQVVDKITEDPLECPNAPTS